MGKEQQADTERITIEKDGGGYGYYAVLTIDMKRLQAATNDKETTSLAGRELCNALLKKYGATLELEEHCQNGQHHDPADGSAAYRYWHENGALRWEEHCQNGLLQDAADGSAAYRHWDENGALRWEEHCQNGQRHDPADGSAAVREWDENGNLCYLARYTDGKLTREITDKAALAKIQKEGESAQIETAFGGALRLKL